MLITGWIVDVYEDPLGGLVVWFLNEDGQRQRLYHRFPITFYANGEEGQLKALENYLGQQPVKVIWNYELRYDVFERAKILVLSIEVAKPVDLSVSFGKVRKLFPYLTYYDVDIPISLRYTAKTGLYLLCKCQLEVEGGYEIKNWVPEETAW